VIELFFAPHFFAMALTIIPAPRFHNPSEGFRSHRHVTDGQSGDWRSNPPLTQWLNDSLSHSPSSSTGIGSTFQISVQYWRMERGEFAAAGDVEDGKPPAPTSSRPRPQNSVFLSVYWPRREPSW
jgi:hypothetical protein